KMFASDPPTMTLSSRAWAVGVLSAAGSGVIRGDVGRVAMPDDIPTARIRAGTRHHVGAGVACHQMAYEDILYANRGRATWSTITRPERRNAVRPQTYTELRDAFRRAAADEATGFVVLTGAGAGFCAGDDFQEIFLAETRTDDR